MTEQVTKAKKTGGRHRGVPNRITSAIRDGALEAWERLGGADGLVAWAERDDANYREFLKLFFKMAPKEVIERKDGVIEIIVQDTFTKHTKDMETAIEEAVNK